MECGFHTNVVGIMSIGKEEKSEMLVSKVCGKALLAVTAWFIDYVCLKCFGGRIFLFPLATTVINI